MLAGPLKKRFVWSQLVDQNAEIEGIFLSGGSKRIKDAIAELVPGDQLSDYPVSVHLKFGVDRKARASVQGECRWHMVLACARCEGPVEIDLEAVIDLLIVTTDSALDRLDADEDGVLAEGKWVSLSDVIEDPILLALPMSPRHEHCLGQVNEAWASNETGTSSKHLKSDLAGQDENLLTHLAEAQNENELTEGPTKRPFANLRALLAEEPKA
jgi:uncharacterized metal-binding protein YceD (DUF177 family)